MINALCHRSYEVGSGPIHLAIYDDIVEITNSGLFRKGSNLPISARVYRSCAIR